MWNRTEGRGLCVAPFLELSHYASKEGCKLIPAVNCPPRRSFNIQQICQDAFVPLFLLQKEALSAVYHAPSRAGSTRTVSRSAFEFSKSTAHCPA